MRKIFKSFMLVAAAAMTFASCQREELNAPKETVSATLTMHAGVEQTKTYIGENNTVLWGTDEAVKLYVGAGEDYKFVSSSTSKYNGQETATFEFSISGVDASGPYNLGGIYPASATVDNTNPDTYKVILPDVQEAEVGKYDPSAYIMVLKPETVETLPTEYQASFRRATALNKITLTGVNEDISSVEITVPEGKEFAGCRYFNVMDGTSGKIYYDKTNTIKVNSPFTGESIDVWFCSWGVELDAGEELTVKMYADENTYTRTITAKENGITFAEGMLNTLKISMAGINPDVQEQPGETTEVWTLVTDASTLVVGDKVVIAAAKANYALSTDQRTNNRNQAAITKNNNTATIAEDVQVLTIEAGTKEGTYAFNTGSGYLYAASSSKNYLKTETKLSDNSSWTISVNADGVATIKANGSNTRNWLRYNSTNTDPGPIFSCYASGQADVVLYRLESDNEGGSETPEPEPEERTLVSIAVSDQTTLYTVGETFEFDGTVTATYSDESTATVTPTSVSAPDMTTKGTKTVTVTYAEGDLTVSAEYEIEVVEVQDLPKGIASIKSKATSNEETDFTVTLTDAVVTYVSGSSAYIEDAEAGILVYKSGHGLAVGDKLNGEVSGKVKLYYSLREVTAIDYSNATKTTGAEIPVTVLTLAELNADGAYDKYENMRIKIENATVSAAKQISQNGQTYALYFKNTSVTGFDIDNTIDVIGYPSKYNADIQFNVWENAVVKKASKTTITGVSDLTVAVGASKVINASASSGEKVTYVSAEPTIATVDETGTVTGIAEGETTITVSVPANDVYPAAEQTCKVTVTAGQVAKAWTLVTDASTLKAGDIIRIGCSTKNKAAGAMGSNKYFASVDATYSNGIMTSSNAIDITLGGSAGAWTLTTNEGAIGTSAAKALNKAGTGAKTWTISISNGNATIKSTTTSYGWIQYNASSPRFLNYASNQTSIQIYRYE